MEWTALVLLSVASGVAGLDWVARCSPQAAGLALTASAEPVPARYAARWCSREAAQARVLQWKLVLFVESDGEPRCHSNDTLRLRHSLLTEVINQQFHCDEGQQVCFTAELDLLYSSCYVLQSRALLNSTLPAWTDIMEQTFLINDSLPYSDIYNQATPLLKTFYGEPTTVHWYFGRIPVTDYKIDLERVSEDSAEAVAGAARNCSRPRRGELECRLRLAAGARYDLLLEHAAPWARGDALPARLKSIANVLEYNATLPAAVEARFGYWAAAGWAAGGAGAAALLVLLAARRRWALARLRSGVKRAWLPYNAPEERLTADQKSPPSPKVEDSWENEPEGERGGCGGAERPQLLLLYARDCAPLMQAAAALRALLHHTAEVWDLHCPVTVAALAADPAGWLRRAMEHRVLLLETPAAAMLYGRGAASGAAPLLGRRVQYRRATPADALLQLALQLLRDRALQPAAHHRIFIATLDASTPLLADTQRYRRYPLPGAAARLLRDLAPAAPPAPPPAAPLAALRAALDLLQQHVRLQPDYLKDELLFL